MAHEPERGVTLEDSRRLLGYVGARLSDGDVGRLLDDMYALASIAVTLHEQSRGDQIHRTQVLSSTVLEFGEPSVHNRSNARASRARSRMRR